MSELRTEGLYPKSRRANPTIRRLALSILVQALRDVMAKPKRTGETEFWRGDALDWFAEADYYPGGLLWVCDVLERDPREVQAWVEEYKHAEMERRKELAKRVGQLRKGGL